MKHGSRLKTVLLTLFLLFSTLVSPLIAQERFRRTPPLPEPLPELKIPEIQSTSLWNGLTLWIIQKDNLPIISLRVIMFAGESSSPEELPGMATLAAHMISRGTSDLSSSQIEEEIDYVGGSFSTSIHPDYALFSFTFLEEYLDRSLDLLSRMLLQPSFLRREIDAIKRTMYYDLVEESSSPDFLAKRQMLRLLFENHPYKKGTFNEEVIKNLTQKDLVPFFYNNYRPNNAHIILTGNLDLATAERKVRSYFQRWQKREMRPALPQSPESNKEKIRVCFINNPKAKEATLYLGNVVIPATNPDIFPLQVMNQVLGGTPNSRLFLNLRESKEYAYQAFSQIEYYKNCSVFFINAKVRPEVVEASIQEILNEIRLITNKKVSTFEIEQAKSYTIGNFPLQIESLADLTSKVVENKAMNLGDNHWKRYYENIMLVTSDKVFELSRRIPLLTPVVVVVGDSDIILNQFGKFIKEVEIFNDKGVYLGTYKFD
jgi:zinc protease